MEFKLEFISIGRLKIRNNPVRINPFEFNCYPLNGGRAFHFRQNLFVGDCGAKKARNLLRRSRGGSALHKRVGVNKKKRNKYLKREVISKFRSFIGVFD
jgi:hypothetical protein